MSGLGAGGRRRLFAWLGLVLATCVAAFTGVYWFTVWTVTGRELAEAAIRGAMQAQSQAARAVNAVLDLVTATMLLAAVAGVAVVALIRLRRVSGLVAIGLLVSANLSARILKVYILPRSDLGLTESAPATLNSLPSGHTTAAFSIGVAVLFVVPAALRAVTATLGIVFSSAVAIATMSAGWHRVGDSLASFFLVTAWAAVAGIVVLLADREFQPTGRSGHERQPGRWWAAISIGLLLIAASVLAVLAADAGIRDSSLGPPIAFVTGGLLIVGTASALTVVVWRIVTRISDAEGTTAVPPAVPADETEAPAATPD